jgi:hypothetical protein
VSFVIGALHVVLVHFVDHVFFGLIRTKVCA